MYKYIYIYKNKIFINIYINKYINILPIWYTIYIQYKLVYIIPMWRDGKRLGNQLHSPENETFFSIHTGGASSLNKKCLLI